MSATPPIRWKIKFSSPCETVFALLATDDGRARFWAEETTEKDGVIHFRFPMGLEQDVPVLISETPRRYAVRYFGAETTFDLAASEDGGCDLTLTAIGVGAEEWNEVHAGWISVLMALKAAADHAVDLRNHDPKRSWDQGYADN